MYFDSFVHLSRLHGAVAKDEASRTSPVRVPFLGEKYDGDDLRQYPESKNWDMQVLFSGLPTTRTKAEAFLQQWLFFGTLVESFRLIDIKVFQDDFVDLDMDGKECVTTEALEKYYELACKFAEKTPAKQQQEQALHIRKILGLLMKFLDEFVCIDAPRSHLRVVRSEIGLSLTLLGITLDNLCYRVLGGDEMDWRMLVWSPLEILRNRLLENGLCPYKINQLERSFAPDTLYFISLLRHQNIFDHSRCTVRICMAQTIDESNYKQRHRRPDCVCENLSIPIEEVCDKLNQDYIPIVLVDQNHEIPRDKSMPIAKAGPDIDYIAISHVWSDGMGNPKTNSLPRCMVESLSELVKAAAEKAGMIRKDRRLAFWIDTLCVPVHPDLKKYRKRAIRRMKDTYEGAGRVLVIERELEETEPPSDYPELFLRLVVSKWFQRLWTLQECVFARKLDVDFRGQIVRSDDMYEQALNRSIDATLSLSSVPTDSLRLYLEARAPSLYFRKDGIFLEEISSGEFSSSLLGAVITTLGDRQTTRAGDEAICLATLMGMDPGDIVTAQDDQKMKLFYSKCKKIPPTFLFHPSQRLEDPGFRWAPRSFLGNWSWVHTSAINGSPCERHDSHGLKVPYPVFLLSVRDNGDASFPQTQSIIFRDEILSAEYVVTLPQVTGAEENKGRKLPSMHKPAIIVGSWDLSKAIFALASVETSSEEYGILAKYETILDIKRCAPDRTDSLPSDCVFARASRKPEDTPFWVS